MSQKVHMCNRGLLKRRSDVIPRKSRDESKISRADSSTIRRVRLSADDRVAMSAGCNCEQRLPDDGFCRCSLTTTVSTDLLSSYRRLHWPKVRLFVGFVSQACLQLIRTRNARRNSSDISKLYFCAFDSTRSTRSISHEFYVHRYIQCLSAEAETVIHSYTIILFDKP